MKKSIKQQVILIITLVIIGQIVFAFMSKDFTTPRYESKIYSTTGVQHDSSDLHKLNEAAHYFGQTIIGWTKFPHFMSDLSEIVGLPEGSSINAHMQERQNIIFTVYTPEPIEMKKLVSVKDYIQGKLDSYNSVNRTKFVLSSLDYEQIEVQKTYGYGAGIALLVSFIIGIAVLFIRKEFFA
jgi:hypothetical protein